jgi:hypothetical protein
MHSFSMLTIKLPEEREGNGAVRFISEERVDDKVVGRARRVSGRVAGGTNKIIFRAKYKLEGDELTIL